MRWCWRMYGERSSERVNVRVVLHIRQTLPNHRRRTTGSGCRRMSCNWHGSHFVKPFLPWAFDARWEEGQRAKRCSETFCPFSSVINYSINHRYLSKGIGNGSMNLISHAQSMLRLQLKIHIVRSSCFMDYRDRDLRITGSQLCEWYRD